MHSNAFELDGQLSACSYVCSQTLASLIAFGERFYEHPHRCIVPSDMMLLHVWVCALKHNVTCGVVSSAVEQRTLDVCGNKLACKIRSAVCMLAVWSKSEFVYSVFCAFTEALHVSNTQGIAMFAVSVWLQCLLSSGVF